MKRHHQLQPLSRQHHNGLLAALLLKKGVKKNAGINDMRAFILHFWDNDLKQHFDDEENFLLPALKNTSLYDDLGIQLLHEHNELRELINLFQQNINNSGAVEKFADLLEAHIRFEERILFPKAEEILTEEQLQIIGDHLHENNDENCINYSIKFWE